MAEPPAWKGDWPGNMTSHWGRWVNKEEVGKTERPEVRKKVNESLGQ